MKKTYQRLTAGISAIILCISSSVSIISADTMTTPPYIPEGLPVADGVTQADDETAALLNSICDELKENVYTLFENNENHDVRADLLLEHSYVIYESTDQAELDEAKKYCDEHGIAEYLVWLRFTGPVNTVIYTENEEEHDEHITDHSVIVKLLTDFISENELKEVYIKDDTKYGKVIIDIWPDTEKVIREFIESGKICYKEAEVLVKEFSYTEQVTGDIVYGDLNDDRKVDMTDLTSLSLAIIGDNDLTDDQLRAADIDENGQADLTDLARIKQYISKSITSLRYSK